MQRVITHHSNNHCYTTSRKPGKQNNRQLWVYDESSKTVKSFYEIKDRNNQKRSMDFRSTHITVQNTDSRWYQMISYSPSGHLFTDKSLGANQEWYAHVQSKTDSEMRATYRENSKKDEDYQKWDIVYVDEAMNLDSGFAAEWGWHIMREFHIISDYGENRFLDLVSNRAVIKTHNHRDSQIFRFDMTYRTLKSKGYSTAWSHSLDMRNSNWLYVYGTGSQWHQLFRYNQQTKQIYNQNGKVLDIHTNKDREGEYVGTAGSDTKRVQQRWTIRYVDKMNKTATSGIGSMGNIEIGRPFFIQSQLWMQRVMYHHPNNHVYIHARKPTEKRQMWIYDEHSKTIKSFYEVDRN